MEADEALARQLQRAEMEGMGAPLIFPVGARAPEGDEARQTRMNAFDQYVHNRMSELLMQACIWGVVKRDGL